MRFSTNSTRHNSLTKYRLDNRTFLTDNEQGSHSTLFYGKKFTIIRNTKDELKTGTFNAMLKQLGIKETDLR